MVLFWLLEDWSGFTWELCPSARKVWEDGCQTIKTLRALRRFTLELEGSWVDKSPEAVQNLLEPLKDLSLKDPWELKMMGSQDELYPIDTALKAAGFDCFVTSVDNEDTSISSPSRRVLFIA